MKNILMTILVLAASLSLYAEDNLLLSRYTKANEVPASFFSLAGPEVMNKSYQEDSSVRSDKVFYTATQSYKSTYRLKDLQALLDPSKGQLDRIFENTVVTKGAGDFYNFILKIPTPFIDYECSSKMTFASKVAGKKTIFTYRFTDWNHVFTDMVIQVEAEEKGSETAVSVSQLTIIKGTTYDKIKSVFAVGKLEKSLKANVNAFKKSINGH